MTPERLRELVTYDPDTGIMSSRVKRHGKNPGDRLGSITSTGYLVTQIEGYKTSIHRFIWLYMYGRLPFGETDHINGNRLDNRLPNLREVPGTFNQQNRATPRRGSKVGYIGVSLAPYKKKYRAQIEVNGKGRSLGFYATAEEAHAAYLEAKRKMHAGYVPRSVGG